ncbi:fas-associated death domain protein [Bombus pascuorum]|uniref:fas-associated death domain protein n=1 Tax=Bombus pascuorum TaxID=65598 RepID=UPI002135807E|nr:fas-associated death domain protein [Bombus pascuorum]
MEQEYICLRKEFLSATENHVDKIKLNILKEYYRQSIDSNRKLSQIKDLSTLLDTLEKRDVLSCYNVEPLLYISNKFFNDFQGQSKLKNYQIYIQNIQYPLLRNMYQESNENKDEDKCKISYITENRSSQVKVLDDVENQSTLQYKDLRSSRPTQESMLQQMILLRISEKIGRSWRDTLRYLQVPEYQIDIIEHKHPFHLKEQSYEALKLYMTQYSNNNWKINLMHALEKARRKDLKEIVEKLILESNN